MDKNEERARLKKLRDGIQNRADRDRDLYGNLLGLPALERAGTIFCYVSVGSEAGTRELIRWALDQGKRVCVPKCEGNGRMRCVEIHGLEELKPAPHYLLEPEDGAVIGPEEIELCIVPGLGFTKDGRRLGYGGGYYDRFLTVFLGTAIGLCYDRQLCQALPLEDWDRSVDIIVTDERVLVCGQTADL